MIIGILQPAYLPWLGFFEQYHRSDVFVLLDDDSYHKNDWRNRNRIKTPQGAQWITVPVCFKYSEQPLLSEVLVNNRVNWRRKHLQALKQNYSKAEYFDDYIEIFEATYQKEWNLLFDVSYHLLVKILQAISLDSSKIVLSSSLKAPGKNQDKLIHICRALNADVFYEGSSGRNYIDESRFLEHGIRVEYQEYNHPVYKQLYGDFISHLSVADLLFNYGSQSLPIILKGIGK